MAQQFTHTPEPPDEPASHPHQRWFRRQTLGHGTTVFRDCSDWKAQLGIRSFTACSWLHLDLLLTADECDELARALIDAAHDLRRRPAQTPAKEAA